MVIPAELQAMLTVTAFEKEQSPPRYVALLGLAFCLIISCATGPVRFFTPALFQMHTPYGSESNAQYRLSQPAPALKEVTCGTVTLPCALGQSL